jgi:hypothetical protein
MECFSLSGSGKDRRRQAKALHSILTGLDSWTEVAGESMNTAMTHSTRADARQVRLLLMDFVRRWREWIIIAPFLLMPWLLLLLEEVETVPPFLLYFTVLLWGPWFSSASGGEWIKAIRTVPVTRTSLATATWIQSVAVFVLLQLATVLAALTIRSLVANDSIALRMLPVIFAVTLSLTGSICFGRICLARASMLRALGKTRWERHGAATAYRLAALAPVGPMFILFSRAPVKWEQVTPLSAGAIAAGLAFTVLSSLGRQWLLVNPSSFSRKRASARRRHSGPLMFPSRWWARYRPYVLATALVFGMTVLTCGLEGWFLVSNETNKSSCADMFAGILAFYALAFTVAMTAVSRQSAMRAHRALPVSSLRFAFGEVTRCILMYAAFAVIACPYAYSISGRGIALSLGIATACLGASILGNGLILLGSKETVPLGTGVFFPFFVYLTILIMMVGLTHGNEPYVAMGLFVTGGILAAIGVWILHHAVAHSSSPYRIDDATRAAMSQR